MTALIDIVFIVIVFLLLCINTALVELSVDLPQSEKSAPAEATEDKQTLMIQLNQHPPYFSLPNELGVSYSELGFDELKDLLLSKNTASDQRIEIASHKRAPVEPLLQLLEFLNAHQLNNTHILMEHTP